MERATGTEVYGCGSPQTSDITLNIQTTTGGSFSISLNGKNTVDHLKKLVSKKLRVGKDRICLLHRERQLTDGTLEENGLLDGSRVILLPSVETGLLSQRPENSVMQALESLNDTQVNDFLSGKSPLNLTMRLGDHMMLIQLQLSTLTSSASGRSLRTSTPTKTPAPVARPKCEARETPSPQATPQKPSTSTESTEESDKPKRIHIIQKQDLEMLQNAFDLYRSMADEKYADKSESTDDKEESMDTTNSSVSDTSSTSLDNEQSPIKSLSNLVSSPIDASTSESRDAALVNTVKSNLIDLLSQSKLSSDVIPSTSAISDEPCPSTSSLTPDSSVSDDSDNFADQSSFLAESTIDEYPMENLFNSAIDKGLFEQQDESMMDREISNLATTSHGAQEATTGALPSFQSINEPLKNKRFQYLLHKTSKFKHPIGQSKQKAFMQSVVNKHKKRMQIKQDSSQDQPSTSQTDPFITNSRKLILQPTGGQAVDNATPSTSKQSILFKPPNTEAWIEASKSLKQKLKKMAQENAQAQPSTSRLDPAVENARRLILQSSSGQAADNATPSTSKQQVVFRVPDAPRKPQRASPTPLVDTKALIEASKNLTQKLKKLSKEVLTNKIDLRGAEEAVRQKIGPGAVIESMKHHGKGIYSGTFSGTLNPALQDRYGRPKRDISTIIHILNDLLCASPPLTAAQKEQQQKHSCATPAAEPCASCGQAACALGQCEGHPAPAPCACDDTCKKCDTAKTLALDNSKTKCKLEQLRLVMQQKKQRREARKLKTLPYPAPPKTLPSQDQTTPRKEEIETLA